MRLAFVLLEKPGVPEVGALEEAARGFPGLEGLQPRDADKDAVVVRLGEGEAIVSAMPAPVPKGEADAVVRHSLSSLRGWTLPRHGGHLVVAALGKDDGGLGALTRFTRLVAAVSDAAKGVGVYWGPGPVTHEPEFFSALAKDELPLALWVGASIAPAAGGRVEVLSRGLKQFKLPELLLTAPGLSNDAVGFFYDLLGYVVRRGAVPRAGETVGRTAEEKLEVSVVDSPVPGEAKVWRVELP